MYYFIIGHKILHTEFVPFVWSKKMSILNTAVNSLNIACVGTLKNYKIRLKPTPLVKLPFIAV
jgi:hypothetical protein